MSGRYADGEVEVPDECLHSSGQKNKAQHWARTAYKSKLLTPDWKPKWYM